MATDWTRPTSLPSTSSQILTSRSHPHSDSNTLCIYRYRSLPEKWEVPKKREFENKVSEFFRNTLLTDLLLFFFFLPGLQVKNFSWVAKISRVTIHHLLLYYFCCL